jgi:hypothetical protein
MVTYGEGTLYRGISSLITYCPIKAAASGSQSLLIISTIETKTFSVIKIFSLPSLKKIEAFLYTGILTERKISNDIPYLKLHF